ncbi:MAG: 4Fe-4S binding protein [Desulfovibrio sp.]|jgi:ferredoxin|nr:4Fe-4S binding protein [Desulfovibrio sp.]
MSIQDDIKAAIAKALQDIPCVIGWGAGPEPLRATPLFMRNAADVENFTAGFLAVNNPALYLPSCKGVKTALVVKGCDARSVGQLVAENLVKRDELYLIGYPCSGVIDVDKVAARLEGKCEPGEVTRLREENEDVILDTPGGEVRLAKKDIAADKCARCRYPNAESADVFIGEKRAPVVDQDEYADLADFEKLSLEERKAFWEKELSRCIRCYACRNACPLCVCRDHCVASSREPHWLTQADGVRDKLFFQLIHATHLAGRCTGCGECERACPVGIPVLTLKRAFSRQVEDMFGYMAGIDVNTTPPLLTFRLEEPEIKEREW